MSTEPDLPSDDRNWFEKPRKIVDRIHFRRFVIRTHLVDRGESLVEALMPYLEGRVLPRDIIVLSEKIVAISENRAIALDAVRIGLSARWLSRHVGQLGYGLGLRRPETMQVAINQAGLWRIGLAAAAGAVDRVTGRSGDFYRVAGRAVAAIDGPGPSTIPPYDRFIVLAPIGAQKMVDDMAERLPGTSVAVVDVNDVGSEVLAVAGNAKLSWIRALTFDNPMGQGKQRTPIAVFRPADPTERRISAELRDPADPSLGPQPGIAAGLGPMSFGVDDHR